MPSLQSPFLMNRLPFSFPQLSFPTSSSYSCIVHAMDKDSRQFEVDPEKAKEALRKLDQQLETLSKKQVSPPRIKASEIKLTRDPTVEETEEISGSFLANLAVVLVVLTIFYNVLFYTVIKPSIDGPDSVDSAPMTSNERDSAAVLQWLPPIPGIPTQEHSIAG